MSDLAPGTAPGLDRLPHWRGYAPVSRCAARATAVSMANRWSPNPCRARASRRALVMTAGWAFCGRWCSPPAPAHPAVRGPRGPPARGPAYGLVVGGAEAEVGAVDLGVVVLVARRRERRRGAMRRPARGRRLREAAWLGAVPSSPLCRRHHVQPLPQR